MSARAWRWRRGKPPALLVTVVDRPDRPEEVARGWRANHEDQPTFRRMRRVDLARQRKTGVLPR